MSAIEKRLGFCLCNDCPTLECIRQGCILYICQLTKHNLPSLYLFSEAQLCLYPFSLFHEQPSSSLFFDCFCQYFRMKIVYYTAREKLRFDLYSVSGHYCFFTLNLTVFTSGFVLAESL